MQLVWAVREGGNNAQVATLHGTEGRNPNSMSHSGTVREGLPTPASLAEVMLSTRQMLIEQIGESLLVCLSVPFLCSFFFQLFILLFHDIWRTLPFQI